jgi:Cytochrome P460
MRRISVLAALVLVTAIVASSRAQSPAPAPVMPRYDKDRALVLPADYRRWILAGTSLGLSYAEGAAPAHPMFHETLIEPTAYQHFVDTGEFREGTMLVLIVHGVGEGSVPSRHGQYATDVHGVEMAVKDRGRVPEAWAYYAFGDAPRAGASTAQPNTTGGCYSCHSKNAARDNVFMQFYSLLSAAAPPPRAR